MLTIEEKALDAAKAKGGVFIIKTLSAPGGEFDIAIKDIVVELNVKFEGSERNYTVFEYEGIKVYLERYLRFHEDIRIYQRCKLPLIDRIFRVSGVEVKYT